MSLQVFIEKSANAAEEELVKAFEAAGHWIKNNPKKAIGLGLAGGAATTAGAVGLGAAVGIPTEMISKGIASHHPVGHDSFAARHPYTTSFGADVATVGLTGLNPIAGAAARMGSIPVHQALAQRLIKKIKNKEDAGILGEYSYNNPHLGSLISSVAPGLGINTIIAGEGIADRALKNHDSFMYKHPIIGAMGGSLIPGSANAYYNAAAKIMQEQNK